MALQYTPLTELDAVNMMLNAIGEQPVASVDDSGLSEASLAQRKLHNVNRAVQGQGLNCNSEEDYPLTPDLDGYIAVPLDALEVDPTDTSKDYVVRAGKLYNKTDHTFTHDEQVKVDVIFFLPFEDLPAHCRNYIAIRAAREFQAETIGAKELYGLTEKEESEALAEFNRHEILNDDKGMLDDPYLMMRMRRVF